jgi:NADPH-dependent 2,4-dienoyl-CoA reductase/sulfur reductase-like enzyme
LAKIRALGRQSIQDDRPDARLDACFNMSKQVTILGAGVIGLSTALYCARRGMR